MNSYLYAPKDDYKHVRLKFISFKYFTNIIFLTSCGNFLFSESILERALFCWRSWTFDQSSISLQRSWHHVLLCSFSWSGHHIFFIQRNGCFKEETGSDCRVWLHSFCIALWWHWTWNESARQRSLPILCPSTGKLCWSDLACSKTKDFIFLLFRFQSQTKFTNI